MLIAFIALANYLIAFPQMRLGVANPVTWRNLFGWLNAPFAFLMGVPAQFYDCDLRALRFRKFCEHRDSSGRHRLARARTPQRNGQNRFSRDDWRPARQLYNCGDCRNVAIVMFALVSRLPNPS